MRFLIDECTGRKLTDLLKKEGHDVLFVGDVMRSASDEEIIRKCEKDDRILITDDKDFGELVFRSGRPTRGIILLRIVSVPEKRLLAIAKLLETHDIKDRFTVLEETVVRSRKTK